MHEYKLKLTQEVGLFATLAVSLTLFLSCSVSFISSPPGSLFRASVFGEPVRRWSIQGAVMIPHIQERLALNLPATVGMRVAVRGEKSPHPSDHWQGKASVTLAEHQG